jgi:hypothetical protein
MERDQCKPPRADGGCYAQGRHVRAQVVDQELFVHTFILHESVLQLYPKQWCYKENSKCPTMTAVYV